MSCAVSGQFQTRALLQLQLQRSLLGDAPFCGFSRIGGGRPRFLGVSVHRLQCCPEFP
jgi:hypothetical protein